MQFAIRLLLRACTGDSDKALERILTRTRIATMPTEVTGTLTESCLSALDKAVRDKVTQTSDTQQRFNVAAEVLSRLAIRLEPDQAESILNKAVEYCRNAELAKSFVDGTIRNLLMRSWEALPEERRQHRAMDLLGSDIVGLSGVEPIMERNWPDPGEIVASPDTILLRTPEKEPQWQDTIDLIARALTDNATSRRRASIRMMPMVNSNLLTEGESLKIASSLWSEQYISPNGLPEYTAMFYWQFLALPEPTPGLAQERFRRTWMSTDKDVTYDIQRNVQGFQIYGNSSNGLNHNPGDVESRLWQTGRAMLLLQERGEELILSSTEKAHIESLLECWAEDPVQDPRQRGFSRMFANLTKQRIQEIAMALPPVIEGVEASSALGGKIYAKMQQLTEDRIPALSLAGALVRVIPERSEDIAITLRVGMTTDDDELAASAASGIFLWLKATSDSEFPGTQPPDDLVREVGIAIASRRRTVIVPALQVATWIFQEGHESQKDSIRQLVEGGLNYLAQELRYDRSHENPEEIPRKTTLLRRTCSSNGEGRTKRKRGRCSLDGDS